MRGRQNKLAFGSALLLLTAIAVPGLAAEPSRTNWSGRFMGSARDAAGTPETQPIGTVTVMLSLTERRFLAIGEGRELASSACSSEAAPSMGAGPLLVLDQQRSTVVAPIRGAGQRLDWQADPDDGAAVGKPGLPAGCGRLPAAFAAKLISLVPPWTPVLVVRGGAAPEVVEAAALSVTPDNSTPRYASLADELLTRPDLEGQAERSPLVVIVSATDRMVYVLRDGRVTAELRVAIRNPFNRLGEMAFVRLAPRADGGARWRSIPLAGKDRGRLSDMIARLEFLEPEKARVALSGMTAGALLTFTDRAAGPPQPIVQRHAVTTSSDDRSIAARPQAKPQSKPSPPARTRQRRESLPVPEKMPDKV